MAFKFHITPKGPKRCMAFSKNCPYSEGEHFNSMDAAQEFFENFNSEKLFPKLSREEKVFVDPPELTEENMKKLLGEFFPQSNLELEGFGYLGSKLFGLETPTSDTDFFLLTTGRSKDRHKIVGEIDVRVSPVYSFVEGLQFSTPDSIHIIKSGTLKFTQKNAWQPYFSAFHFDSYHYFAKTYTHMENDFRHFATKMGGENERSGLKSLKTALRSGVLLNKLNVSDSTQFRPVFTAPQRNRFFETLGELSKDRYRIADFETDSFIESIVSEGKRIMG